MKIPINYVRLERPKTKSWITYRLSRPVLFTSEADQGAREILSEHLAKTMPGWEIVCACQHNPDSMEK